MLRSVRDLEQCAIGASDGVIGTAQDFLFDDKAWVIRYLVVDTGAWLLGREALIPAHSIGAPDWERKLLPVSISRGQVRDSPSIDTDKPVSRQHEVTHLDYYGYPYYWDGVETPEPAASSGDPHLRTCNAVVGYHLRAGDGDIGHVRGFLVDEESWTIRYVVVNTSHWWSNHLVLVSPEWINSVSWPERSVTVDLKRRDVKRAPAYDAAVPMDRSAEAAIFAHYRLTPYWKREVGQHAA